MSVLQATDLTCGYAARKVLDGLSLSIEPGEILVLLGPNGAGKTTLLRALARLLRPLRGTVLLEGRDLWQCSAAGVSQQIALMPQSEQRDWPLTVEQSVRLGRAPHRGWLFPYSEADEQALETALVDTGVRHLRQRAITELSGGEWRRVIFARALAQQAKVLLLDEPVSGLDLKYQHEVLRLTRHLSASRGLTVILSLHDLNLAALYGDRLAVIAQRSVVALGSPQEVLTADLIERVFEVRAAVVQHPIYGTPIVAPLMDDTVNLVVSDQSWG